MPKICAFMLGLCMLSGCATPRSRQSMEKPAVLAGIPVCAPVPASVYAQVRIAFIPFPDMTVEENRTVCQRNGRMISVVQLRDAQGLHDAIVCLAGQKGYFSYAGFVPSIGSPRAVATAEGFRSERIMLERSTGDRIEVRYGCEPELVTKR